jgi:regulator of nucleoside diphosphate kinase
LRSLLGAHPEASLRDQEHLQELKSELERAFVVDVAHVPSDVVIMHARVQVLDLSSHERKEYILAFPSEADVAERRISVLAPLGTALLGYREGDEVEWEMPGGLRRLRLEKVIQPAMANVPQPTGRGALTHITAAGVH